MSRYLDRMKSTLLSEVIIPFDATSYLDMVRDGIGQA
jgi:hypothetical protein